MYLSLRLSGHLSQIPKEILTSSSFKLNEGTPKNHKASRLTAVISVEKVTEMCAPAPNYVSWFKQVQPQVLKTTSMICRHVLSQQDKNKQINRLKCHGQGILMKNPVPLS